MLWKLHHELSNACHNALSCIGRHELRSVELEFLFPTDIHADCESRGHKDAICTQPISLLAILP